MKYLLVAALLGAFTTDARHHKHHHVVANRLNQIRSRQDEGSPPATKWDKDHPHPGYPAGQEGFEGKEGLGGYNRKIPEQFGGPGSGDDQFMHSVLRDHATESASATGTPSGNFHMNKAGARHLASEILDTHMGLKGAAAEKYLEENFDKTWTHFDVNGENKVEAARMPGFYRHLTGNQQIPLHLHQHKAQNKHHKSHHNQRHNYAQLQNPVNNPPYNNWSVNQPSAPHDHGMRGNEDLGQREIIIDGVNYDF